ncbi:MAG: RDD family protein [Chlamydiales bacterium]
MNYSGSLRRFCAYILDVIVQLILIGMSALLLERQSFIGLLASGLLLFLLSWFYFAFMESSKYEATVGKLLLGLKVVDMRGNRLSFLRATTRYFGKFLSRLLLGLGFFMMLFTKKRQCLHDKLASTIVVKKG